MKDILIADAGSTKTDWSFFYEGSASPMKFSTVGINPAHISKESIQEILIGIKCSVGQLAIKKIVFFGAGCATDMMKEKISSAIDKVLACQDILVESDLTGAALAAWGDSEGLIAILGTGSATGYFKDGKIKKQIPSLGYLLGDEGSGYSLGRRLLNAIFKRLLPLSLIEKFEEEYHLSLSFLINEVYSKEKPAPFIASFSPFLLKNKEEESIQNLIAEEFDSFFQHNIIPYGEITKEIRMVGSIAFKYQEFLQQSADKFGFKISKVIKEPMPYLEKYFIDR